MNIDALISDKVKNIQPSPIRRFFDLANAMEGTVSLGIGEPDFVTPWHIREAAMGSLRAGETAYTPNAGTPQLRQAVADYLYARFGLRYDPKTEIFVTVGASEAIDLALRVLIDPGDEVLIPDPSYISYSPGALLAGGKSVLLPTYAEDGFALRGDTLRAALTKRSKALVLPYPNNPEELAAVLEETDLPVISDEIYGELTYSGDHASIAQIPGMKERTILISGFSKAFAMTGWRLGFVAADRRFVSQMLKVHQYVHVRLHHVPGGGHRGAERASQGRIRRRGEDAPGLRPAAAVHLRPAERHGPQMLRAPGRVLYLPRHHLHGADLRAVRGIPPQGGTGGRGTGQRLRQPGRGIRPLLLRG